jgi:2-oxo-4-hydroxy-4-carboxy-5-ureidoimidazoline decarboxylase
MMFASFNAASADELRAPLHACCDAEAWVDAILAGRPYADEEALAAASDAATANLNDIGLGQALAGHPRIGERVHSGAWSKQEQSGMNSADENIRAELADANARYEKRFGHVYLVCATGKSAEEMLELCRSRLHNAPDVERGVILEELAKINRLRLTKLLHPEAVSR